MLCWFFVYSILFLSFLIHPFIIRCKFINFQDNLENNVQNILHLTKRNMWTHVFLSFFLLLLFLFRNLLFANNAGLFIRCFFSFSLFILLFKKRDYFAGKHSTSKCRIIQVKNALEKYRKQIMNRAHACLLK